MSDYFFRILFLLFLSVIVPGMSALPLAVTLPPAEYRHEPKVKYEIVELPWDKVDAQCATIERGRVLACARDFGYGLGWVIVMPKKGDVSKQDWQLLLEHEKAHVNGWPKNHPDTYICGDANCSWRYSIERGDER